MARLLGLGADGGDQLLAEFGQVVVAPCGDERPIHDHRFIAIDAGREPDIVADTGVAGDGPPLQIVCTPSPVVPMSWARIKGMYR